jgi:hypothetical protein
MLCMVVVLRQRKGRFKTGPSQSRKLTQQVTLSRTRSTLVHVYVPKERHRMEECAGSTSDTSCHMPLRLVQADNVPLPGTTRMKLLGYNASSIA